MPAAMLDLLSDATSCDVRIRILPDPEPVPFSTVWAEAERAARQDLVAGNVGMQLEASIAALVVLLATWMSGGTAVSLPAPPRTADDAYWSNVLAMASTAGCGGVIVSDEMARKAPPALASKVRSFQNVLRGEGSPPSSGQLPPHASFVQFTSGSTGDPTGIVLGQDAMAANVLGGLEVLEPTPGDGVCSWLPLSHDMGLFGLCLGALTGLGPRGAAGGELALLPMSLFRVAPMRWLSTCSSMGATVTAAPPSVLAMFARLASRARSVDLSSLRSIIIGGEPIDPAALTAFDAAYRPAGLAAGALCPAYGLAELTVAVSMNSPREPWHVAEMRPSRDDAPRSLVSCGRPLRGFSVSTNDEGRIIIGGPSMMTGRLTSTGFVDQDGPLLTSDVGAVVDGEVYVVGRVDDVVLRGGRKIYAFDVERSVDLSAHDVLAAVALRASGDELVLVCEVRARGRDREDPAWRAAIEGAVVSAVGVAPDRTVLVPNGTIPRTPSGKPRREALAAIVSRARPSRSDG